MGRTLCLAVILAVPAFAVAAEPRLVTVEEKGGKLIIDVPVVVQKYVPETITTINNGVPVTQTRHRLVQEMQLVQRVVTDEEGDFLTPAGAKIDPKKLTDVLKKGAVVAVSQDGKPVDPGFLKRKPEVVAVLVPKGPKPVPAQIAADEKPFATTASIKDGTIVIERDDTTYQEVAKQVTRTTAGGKPETVTVKEKVPVTRRGTFTLDSKQVQVLTLDGKVVPPADWGGVIGEKTKVIVSPGGQAVPDELRAANKEVKAVIVLRSK